VLLHPSANRVRQEMPGSSAQQRRTRGVLVLAGLIRVPLRRYHCPQCGAWHCPGQAVLRLWSNQRMTRTVEDLLGRLGLSWSHVVATELVARVLPGLGISAKTVERAVARCAAAVTAAKEQQAAAQDARGVKETGPAFAHPSRIYVGLDRLLERGRRAKEWIEVQVGSLRSAWRELPDRKLPRRQTPMPHFLRRATKHNRCQQKVSNVPLRNSSLTFQL
jgi:hypothetical protein